MKKIIYNFSAGPAIIPKNNIVLLKKNMINWNDTGCSILEINHRNKYFIDFTILVKKKLKKLLNIPNNYAVLILNGGGRLHFSSIAMNLIALKKEKKALYINTGLWSSVASQEAKKFGYIKDINFFNIKSNNNIYNKENYSYIHTVYNETANGFQYSNETNFNGNIVSDMSSSIFSNEINIKKFSCIYASGHKNMGCAGISLIIIKKDLLGYAIDITPSTLNYSIQYKNKSLFNSPIAFSWYMLDAMMDWINIKGIKNIYQKNKEKSELLYSYIDKSKLFYNIIKKKYRSYINIVIFCKSKSIEKNFIQYAQDNGVLNIEGHKKVGGIRISIYNAMPIEGIKYLIELMKNFEKNFFKL